MKDSSPLVIQEYKRMMSQSVRLKNKLEKIIKPILRPISTWPISFDIDKFIEYITAKGFSADRINKQIIEKGYICTIHTRSGLEVNIRHERIGKMDVHFLINDYDCRISSCSEGSIAEIIMEIDALGEKYKTKYEHINAYLKLFRQTPLEQIVSIFHAFEVTDNIQFRIDAADRKINEAFAKVDGIEIKERTYPYCDHVWKIGNVRYDVTVHGNWGFTMIFNPKGKKEAHFRFDSTSKYIDYKLYKNHSVFFNGTPDTIAEFLADLFTDIKQKEKEYNDKLAAYLKSPLAFKYLNAPPIPNRIDDIYVMQLPVFNVTLSRCEQNEFSYIVNGENNTLYIPKSLRYTSPETKNAIYYYLDKIFKEVAQIYIPQRVEYLSKKTGLKYTKCKVKEGIRAWGYYYPKIGTVIINSTLITGPKEEIDATILHELCHSLSDLPGSKVKGHNIAFHEALLKYAGRELYDMNFEDSSLKKRL